MVERKLEPEVIKILELINLNKDFVLSGGAGSGKTYSLVSLINELVYENSNVSIVCITYTNAAVKEISERVRSKKIKISTIHEFLWETIRNYQSELKTAILNLSKNEDTILYTENDLSYTNDLKIQYLEYTRLKDGIISHDELLVIAYEMFNRYPKLSTILQSKYNFIFIDEYQDTSKFVIQIFLDLLNKKNKKTIIGLFGDQMQSIYEDGIGDVNDYILSGKVLEVSKQHNRRNPLNIINLANVLRLDSLKQIHSSDANAPNMLDGKVKEGTIKVLYAYKDIDYDDIKKSIHFSTWNFEDYGKTKELRLTHNLNAKSSGFDVLIEAFDNDIATKINSIIKNQIKKGTLLVADETESFISIYKRMSCNQKKGAVNKGKTDIESRTKELNFFLDYCNNKSYSEIKNIYLNKDQILDGTKIDPEEDEKKISKIIPIIKYLFKIVQLIKIYENKEYNEFIKKTGYKITSNKDKVILKEKIAKLFEGSLKISEVMKISNEEGLVKYDDKLESFLANNHYTFLKISNIAFKEVISLYEYQEGLLSITTQHKIKGLEYDNILVILDNGRWNHYNYSQIFADGDKNTIKRTKKLFYVCCTRAKENLAIIYSNADNNVIDRFKQLLGEENVINVSK